jgi:hypothetical protein
VPRRSVRLSQLTPVYGEARIAALRKEVDAARGK